MTSLPARLALACVAGLLAAVSFEPFAWAYLLPVAVAGLTVAVLGVRLRVAFGLGTAFGTVFMLVLLPWLQVIGVDAWLALSVLEGLFYGLAGVATVLVRRLPWWPVWTASVWVGVEQLRSAVPFGGFPWGRLAFATADTPLADAMAFVGSTGTTFLVALLGTAVVWAAGAARKTPVRAAGAVLGVLLLAMVPSGLNPNSPLPNADYSPFTVAAVQGNVPGEGMDAFSERRAVLNNHLQATRELAASYDGDGPAPPDLVIWPESSTDIDPFTDPTVYADIQGVVDELGVPILVGAMVGGEDEGDVFNQGIVWHPGTGPGERYSKRHPVPFGEYIPLREQLAPYIQRLDQIPRDMVPGDAPGVLEMNEIDFGLVICFEIAYDDVVRDAAAEGTQVLVVQTNNATYMGTGQVEQQFAISRLRALETGRPVIVAATNGVTGVISPEGEVQERAPVRTRTVVVESVLGVVDPPPALELGLPVKVGLVTISVVSVLVAGVLGYRRRSRREDPAPRPTSVEA